MPVGVGEDVSLFRLLLDEEDEECAVVEDWESSVGELANCPADSLSLSRQTSLKNASLHSSTFSSLSGLVDIGGTVGGSVDVPFTLFSGADCDAVLF